MIELGALSGWVTGGGVLGVMGLIAWWVVFLTRQMSHGEALYETRLAATQAQFTAQLKQLHSELEDERHRGERAAEMLSTEMKALQCELAEVRHQLRLCRAESHQTELRLAESIVEISSLAEQLERLRNGDHS